MSYCTYVPVTARTAKSLNPTAMAAETAQLRAGRALGMAYGRAVKLVEQYFTNLEGPGAKDAL